MAKKLHDIQFKNNALHLLQPTKKNLNLPKIVEIIEFEIQN